MKNAIFAAIAVLTVGGLFYWYSTASASVGNLNIYEGNVTVERSKKEVVGNTGFSIKATDLVKVGSGSRVSIILKDDSVIRLEAGSVMEIDKDRVFHLKSGKMWSKVEPLAVGEKWQVETPTIVAAVRGTQFNTRYSDASSGVSVYKGTVGVSLLQDRENEKPLQKGNQFILGDKTLAEDFAKEPIVMDPSTYDDWIKFNLDEDAKLERETYNPEVTTSQTETQTPATNLIVPTPTGKKLLTVSISDYKSIILINEETRVKATAKYSDNSNYEIPFEKITWIRNSKTGILSSPGYYSSSKPVVITLQAQFENIVSGPITIEVKESLRVLKRIELSYTKNNSENQTYYEYPTVKFIATAVYDDNSSEDISSKTTWSLESGSAMGIVSTNGLYTPETRGDALIKASYEGKSATQSVSIP